MAEHDDGFGGNPRAQMYDSVANSEESRLRAENAALREKLAGAIMQRNLARADYERDRVRMAQVVEAETKLAACEKDAEMDRKMLKHRSVIRINTDQAVKCELVFVPGERPYIHFSANEIRGYACLSGFIDDKDVKKFKRFARSLK